MPSSGRLRFYEFCKVWEVYDGDTVRLLVDLGFGLPMGRVWIRLKGVRCPELKQDGGSAARQATVDWFDIYASDGWVSLNSHLVAGDGHLKEIKERMTFVRFEGDVYAGDNSLNQHLLDLGYVGQGN